MSYFWHDDFFTKLLAASHEDSSQSRSSLTKENIVGLFAGLWHCWIRIHPVPNSPCLDSHSDTAGKVEGGTIERIAVVVEAAKSRCEENRGVGIAFEVGYCRDVA